MPRDILIFLLTRFHARPNIVRMRSFILLVFLAFPFAALAADAARDTSGSIASLTQEVQQLRTENEKLSARLSAIENRLSSPQQKISISNRVVDLDGTAPSVPKEHEKP